MEGHLLTNRRLTFTSTSIQGKKMIIQATNTGADLNEGQFDLAIPGGGVGICEYIRPYSIRARLTVVSRQWLHR